MTEQEKKLQEFKALSADEKKEKLLAIFEFAKDKIDFSENAINYLNSDNSPSDLVMQQFYEFIVSTIFLAKDRLEKQQAQLNDARHTLQAKEQEQIQKDANDVDNLLDLISFI